MAFRHLQRRTPGTSSNDCLQSNYLRSRYLQSSCFRNNHHHHQNDRHFQSNRRRRHHRSFRSLHPRPRQSYSFHYRNPRSESRLRWDPNHRCQRRCTWTCSLWTFSFRRGFFQRLRGVRQSLWNGSELRGYHKGRSGEDECHEPLMP